MANPVRIVHSYRCSFSRSGIDLQPGNTILDTRWSIRFDEILRERITFSETHRGERTAVSTTPRVLYTRMDVGMADKEQESAAAERRIGRRLPNSRRFALQIDVVIKSDPIKVRFRCFLLVLRPVSTMYSCNRRPTVHIFFDKSHVHANYGEKEVNFPRPVN
jgi:hypothetical protein